MKRSIKMLLLLCLLGAVCAGYFLAAQRQEEEAAVTEAKGSFPISEKGAEDITGIEWVWEETDWHFTLSDSTWMNGENSAFPVNQTQLASLAQQLGNLTAVREITDASSREYYGMEEPTFQVTVTYSDGSKATLSQGDETPFADGYYLESSQRPGIIYTIENSLNTDFQKSLSDLAAKERIPTVESFSRLTVGSTLDIRYGEESTTIDPSQHWYDGETGEVLDEEKVTSLLNTVNALAWESVAEVSADDDRLAELLLTQEATVVTAYNASGEEELVLYLGGTASDGSRYARLENSQMVYTLPASDADAILAASKDTLWLQALVTVALEDVQEITFTTDQISYTIAPQAEAFGEEAENETPDGTEPVETEEADVSPVLSETEQMLWEKLTALSAAKKCTDPALAGEQLLAVSICMVSGQQADISICAYDIDFYLLSMTDHPDVLVSAAEADTLLRILRSL